MNNIKIILEAIKELGGSATIEDITQYMCKKMRIMYDGYLKTVVKLTLANNQNEVSYNQLTNNWDLGASRNSNYLYVSDYKYFDTINDATTYIFKMKAPTRKSYFEVKGLKSSYAWFPKFNNSNPDWTNVLIDDGKTWRETPNNQEAIEKEEERHLEESVRYAFAYDKVDNDYKYRFTGVFKQTAIEDDGTRVYSLIDDKVRIISKNPRLIICNISYMKNYQGITDDDQIQGGGGKYPTQNRDGGEKYNFLQRDDGFTYGFVETNYTDNVNHLGDPNYAKKIHIENIDSAFEDKEEATDVRVVFISKGPDNDKHIVVGWYDNATVYRSRQVMGDSFGYNIKCKNEDAHLISEVDRTFEYCKKNEDGTYNFGQSNISYPYDLNGEENSSTYKLADRLNNYIGKKLLLNGFIGYLTQKLYLRLYEKSSVEQYIQSLNQINNQLVGEYIDNRVEEVDDLNTLVELRNKMLDKSTDLGRANESRKNTWSATIQAYINYLKELSGSKCNLFYEPINLQEYNMFEFLKEPGGKETFVATNDMKIGDYLLLHIGSQDTNYESGIYGIVKVLSNPYIYHGEESEHCNNKLSVDTEVVSISNTPLMTHDDFAKYVTQFRSKHKISSDYYDELMEYFNIGLE